MWLFFQLLDTNFAIIVYIDQKSPLKESHDKRWKYFEFTFNTEEYQERSVCFAPETTN